MILNDETGYAKKWVKQCHIIYMDTLSDTCKSFSQDGWPVG